VAATGGSGHFNPLVPFVEALRRRRDDVLVVVPPSLEAMVARAGYSLVVGAEPPADEMAAIRGRLPTAPPAEAAVLGNRELFGRLCTAAMLPTMAQVFADWLPDLVIREPCEYASAVVANRLGIPHAQVAISLAGVEAGSLDLAAPALDPYGDDIVERLRTSPYLTRFPASLDPSPFPTTHRYSEASQPTSAALPPWWEGESAPLVYVTFGSVTGGLPIAAAVYRTALDAVAGLDARVLLTVGRGADVSALGSIPPNVHVEAWVPQVDVLGSAALVVCHGGSGTTFGALASGVPLVIVPLFADQSANGRRVAAVGAGLLVEPAVSSAERRGLLEPKHAPLIAAAITTVLGDLSYREAARRVAGEMKGSPGVDQLLAVLEPSRRPPAVS
jgi:UDP:flavonoid glycosyltransferase YjiC (YdhE family)